MAREGLYEKHEDVNRRLRTLEDLTFANGSVVPKGSEGKVVRVEPAGSLGLVWVARMDDGDECGFTEGQFRFIRYRGARDPEDRRRNGDVTGYDSEADEPTYGLEKDVQEADLLGNRGHRRPIRRNALDEEIRRLERQALDGDADAIHRLAARASHAPALLRPRPAQAVSRNIRNFWIELSVDGKSTRVAAGPSARDGGFSLRILMRDRGGVVEAMEVIGRAIPDGRLVLKIDDQTALTTER